MRINPNDPAHVWIVNRDVHQVHKFTRDGKQLVMTLGWLLRHPGNDDRHFNMPADVAFLPDGAFFVADGYQNSRVVKFDKDGKYLQAWGTFRARFLASSRWYTESPSTLSDGSTLRTATTTGCRSSMKTGNNLNEWHTAASPAHIIPTKDQAVWLLTLGSHRMANNDLSGPVC